MREFISVDFETANPQRVSACAFGYARVKDGVITESNSYLIKPVGGHAPFQSKIHGITDAHTADKPDFRELYPQVASVFTSQLVAHSAFDQQVLRALSDHFAIPMSLRYVDTSRIAREKLPHLKDHKLKSLTKHFGLPKFDHHDAKADAVACAHVYLKLNEIQTPVELPVGSDVLSEFKGMLMGILADNEVNYKEACQLLYWLDDHAEVAAQIPEVRTTIMRVLEDGRLDKAEAKSLADCLIEIEGELDS